MYESMADCKTRIDNFPFLAAKSSQGIYLGVCRVHTLRKGIVLVKAMPGFLGPCM